MIFKRSVCLWKNKEIKKYRNKERDSLQYFHLLLILKNEDSIIYLSHWNSTRGNNYHLQRFGYKMASALCQA